MTLRALTSLSSSSPRVTVAAPRHTTARYTTFTGLADGTKLRTATLDTIEYIIVPVVALVGNSVIWAMNADGPEFVPAEELSRAPQQWNGRPVVPDHPGGGTLSANDPTVLESQRFGMLFNSRFEKGKLTCEAWLDPTKAEKVGGNATSVIESCRAGKMVEVSIGAYIAVEPREGAYNGKKYTGVWHDIISDHLAMGLNGSEGACSNEMGCGAPRAAVKSPPLLSVQPEVKGVKPMKTAVAKLRAVGAAGSSGDGTVDAVPGPTSLSLLDRFKHLLGIRSAADTSGVSDVETREALYQALYSTEPAFWSIERVWPETSTVVYSCYPDSGMILYSRTFAISDAGEVTLNDDREEVELVQDYKPVAARAQGAQGSQGAAATPPCSCHKSLTAANPNPEGVIAVDKKAIVKKIIGLKASPFEDADTATLESMPEAALALLEKKYEAADTATTTTPAAPPTPATPTVPATPATTSTPTSVAAASSTPTAPRELTEAEWLAQAPGTLRDAMTRAMAAEKARHAALVGGLKDRVNGAYTEQQLAAMGASELEALAKVAGIGGQQQVSPGEYFPAILPTSPDAARAAGKVAAPPKPYSLAIAALQGKPVDSTTATKTN